MSDPIKRKVYRRFYEPLLLLKVLQSLSPPVAPPQTPSTGTTKVRRFVNVVAQFLGPRAAVALAEGGVLWIAGHDRSSVEALHNGLVVASTGEQAVLRAIVTSPATVGKVKRWRKILGGCLAQAGGDRLPSLQRVVREGTEEAVVAECHSCLQSQGWRTLRASMAGIPAGASGDLYGELENHMKNLAQYTTSAAALYNGFSGLGISVGICELPPAPSAPGPLSSNDSSADRIIGRMFHGESRIESYRSKLYELNQMYDNFEIPEALAKACEFTTHIHAEMQLVQHFRTSGSKFYESDDAYIASSSGACYLCKLYAKTLERSRVQIKLGGTGEEVRLDWAPPNPRNDERFLLTMVEDVRAEVTGLLNQLYGSGQARRPHRMQTEDPRLAGASGAGAGDKSYHTNTGSSSGTRDRGGTVYPDEVTHGSDDDDEEDKVLYDSKQASNAEGNRHPYLLRWHPETSRRRSSDDSTGGGVNIS